MNIQKTVLICCAALIAASGIYYLKTTDYLSLATIQQHAAMLATWTHAHTYLAVLLYVSAVFISTVCYIPATILLCILGGFLFGSLRATIYAVSGVTLGSMLMFILVRYYFGNYVKKKYPHFLAHLNKEAERYGDYYLLMLQIFPFTPTFIINTGAGLTSICLWNFTWATYVGLIPGTFIYTFAGSKLRDIKQLDDILSWQLMALLIMLSALALLPVILKKMKRTA